MSISKVDVWGTVNVWYICKIKHGVHKGKIAQVAGTRGHYKWRWGVRMPGNDFQNCCYVLFVVVVVGGGIRLRGCRRGKGALALAAGAISGSRGIRMPGIPRKDVWTSTVQRTL